MTQEEWIARCAARLNSRSGMPVDEAKDVAESCLENLDYDLSESPEDAADEEMSCWTE